MKDTIAKLRKLLSEATPGPWMFDEDGYMAAQPQHRSHPRESLVPVYQEGDPDFEGIRLNPRS